MMKIEGLMIELSGKPITVIHIMASIGKVGASIATKKIVSVGTQQIILDNVIDKSWATSKNPDFLITMVISCFINF